jgi:PAS domain-containing protein
MLTPLELKAGAVSEREREERHQLLLDSIEDYAIYMLDCAGNVLTWNRGAVTNKGYSREEIVGCNYRLFLFRRISNGDCPSRNWPPQRLQGELQGLAERILASFKAPVAVSGQQIQTSCSLGAVAFGNGETVEAADPILSKADAAMYMANRMVETA